MEYIVVDATSNAHPDQTIEKKVLDKIENGWTPLGGVAVVPIVSSVTFYQAMTRSSSD